MKIEEKMRQKYIGKEFGSLLITDFAGKNNFGRLLLQSKCLQCGSLEVIPTNVLRYKTQCKHCNRKLQGQKISKDFTSMIFDTGTKVIEKINHTENGVLWRLLCICGEYYEQTTNQFTNPKSRKTCLKCNDEKWELVKPGDIFGDNCVVLKQVKNRGIIKFWLCRCSCGFEWEVDQDHIRHRIKNCKKCAYIQNGLKYAGPNHPGWNPNKTYEERINKRNDSLTQTWRRKVLKRDNYTCFISGLQTDLQVHHIYTYSQNKDLRLDVNNGITLNKKIHELFHDFYGKQSNNKLQLEEFSHIYKYLI